MSREEALKSYTVNNAYAAFEDKLKGSLEPGKLADITVLSKDIMTIPEDEILATDVVYTIVGGKVAFDHTARGVGRPEAAPEPRVIHQRDPVPLPLHCARRTSGATSAASSASRLSFNRVRAARRAGPQRPG